MTQSCTLLARFLHNLFTYILSTFFIHFCTNFLYFLQTSSHSLHNLCANSLQCHSYKNIFERGSKECANMDHVRKLAKSVQCVTADSSRREGIQFKSDFLFHSFYVFLTLLSVSCLLVDLSYFWHIRPFLPSKLICSIDQELGQK